VRRQHERRPARRLLRLLHENGPMLAQIVDDVAIVDDLLAHEDGAVEIERSCDRLDGAFHAGAVSAR